MKKILIVGMLDSIHLARWLEQFTNDEFEIILFPSRKFRRLNNSILKLVHGNIIQLVFHFKTLPRRIDGYLDFLLHNSFGSSYFKDRRARNLAKVLKNNEFDFIHLIEIQHAGYTYLDSLKYYQDQSKIIVTNLGSDIYYYKDSIKDSLMIRKILERANYYSAECARDYKLAKRFGFNGIELPLIPNAGGFSKDFLERIKTPVRKRKYLFVKAYGGRFGLGRIGLIAASRALEKYPELQLVAVSVTPDLGNLIAVIERKFPGRVKSYKVSSPLPHDQVLDFLGSSLIYIGCSKSDGISTTFLEALASGCYPIQTDTSCAGEWLNRGFKASILPPDEKIISNELLMLLKDIKILERAFETNIRLAKTNLSGSAISTIAKTFYQNDSFEK